MGHVSTNEAIVISNTVDSFTYRLTRTQYDTHEVTRTTLRYDSESMRYVLEDGSDYPTACDAELAFAYGRGR